MVPTGNNSAIVNANNPAKSTRAAGVPTQASNAMRLRHFLPPTYRELRRSHVTFVEPANLAVMWSYKAACTTVIKWVFLHNGLLPEALAFSDWIHTYRLRRYQKAERYRARLGQFGGRTFDVVKVVRHPLDRAISSYIHAYRTGYDDESISKVIRRPLDCRQRFSFREFVTFLEHSNLLRCNPHHRVQVAPIERHVLFRTKPRAIIRIEQGLTSALSDLEHSLGLPATDFTNRVFASDHHTVRTYHHGPAADLTHFKPRALPPASAFYDADLSARVVRLYAEDFHHYGYTTDAPQAANEQDDGREIIASASRQAQH